MHTDLNRNPYQAPNDSTLRASPEGRLQQIAGRIAVAALVLLLCCFACFALSTYQVAMRLAGTEDYKAWFAWLLGAVLLWFFATLLAASAVTIRKTRFSLVTLFLTQIPLLLPAWIVALWFWELFTTP